jgi:hypothetical protein
MEKTLIGKNNYLFLKNDESRELDIHCSNLCLVNTNLYRFQKYIHKYYITVFPDKSLIYKNYLPDLYDAKYRPGIAIYKSFFNEKLFDTYEILKDLDDSYYKTDTHINIKGAYLVYCNFVKNINNLYNLKIPINNLEIKCIQNINLNDLNLGIGDLTWDENKGSQIIESILDNYYYSKDIIEIYCRKNNIGIQFFDYELNNKTSEFDDKIIDWNIISKYILYKKNENITSNDSCKKVLIFYDSFLLSTLWLYLTMFSEVYMIKCAYNSLLIDKINPDFIFEFRVERFLT